ncbi:MAG: outer membrane lipoprotein carrier protein LolA [Acidobacteria bacterium]|nr:outer membrane lipoprotein carrier protein LolA [Acidobacteriota bacterium]
MNLLTNSSLLLWLALPSWGQPSQPDVESLVVGIQRHYDGVRDFQASFAQVYQTHQVIQREKGTLFVKKPGKMRWEYQEPEKKLFVADGRNAYFYVPEERQVRMSRFSAGEIHGTPLRFLLGGVDIRQDFQVSQPRTQEPSQEGNAVLKLIPRSPQTQFESILLEVNPATYRIERLVVQEVTGARSEYVLHEVRENVGLKDQLFKFKIPENVEVVREEN